MNVFSRKKQWISIRDILESLEDVPTINNYLKEIDKERSVCQDETISYQAFISSMTLFCSESDRESVLNYITSYAIYIAEKRDVNQKLIVTMKKEQEYFIKK